MSQPNQRIVYRETPRKPTNGFAVTALVLGIVGIVPGSLIPIPLIGFLALFFAFLPALLGLVFGLLGIGKSKERWMAGSGRGMAIAGVVLGGVTMLIAIVTVIVWLISAASSVAGNG